MPRSCHRAGVFLEKILRRAHCVAENELQSIRLLFMWLKLEVFLKVTEIKTSGTPVLQKDKKIFISLQSLSSLREVLLSTGGH